MDHPLLTPSRPPPPTDISTIEQQKENIQPLASGRSASQLATLSSQSRSGLGNKLKVEHDKFASRLKAIDQYDAEETWEEGKDGITLEEVRGWAEDPMSVHQEYVRFIISSYTAGPSANSKLVPMLEQSTRKFLQDGRYTNDPRYLRLWILYAGNIERPEEAYRFLFAKNIGDRLGMLYEEYANVLEAGGKRKQAQEIYELGIARRAAPLERLKKRYLSFQARMLVAPPLPEPIPEATPSSSSTSRAILSGPSISSKPILPGKENGARAFSVFSEDSAPKASIEGQGNWDDFGTVKGRKKENDQEGKEWKGETLHQGQGLATPKGTRLEVFRDTDAPITPSLSGDSTPGPADVFRSVRGPSEAEILRQNPWKNYEASEVKLVEFDPLKDAPSLSVQKSSSAPKMKTSSTSSSSKSRSSSSSKSKSSSSKSATSTTPVDPQQKREEKPYCNLDLIYPSEGVEVSFEELRMRKNEKYLRKVDEWEKWEWREAWREEWERTGRRTYKVDEQGTPLLYDVATGEPLWEFLRPPAPSPVPSPSLVPPHSATPVQRDLLSPSPLASQALALPQQLVESPSPLSHAPTGNLLSPSPPNSYQNPNRPPSPTMNTRQAQALVDGLFAKTLVFGGDDFNEDENDDGDDSEEPETDDDDEESPAFAYERQSQQPSQFSQSTMGALSQESDDTPFVPFSQINASQVSDSSMMGSQLVPGSQIQHQQHLTDVMEENEDSSKELSRRMMDATGDENDEAENVKPAPMALFRDPTPATQAFRPVTKRAPLGAKPVGGATTTPAVPNRLFEVRRDDEPENPVFSEAVEDEQEEEDDLDGPAPRVWQNPYADLVDVMSPISERTYEYSTTTLSASTRSRRESQFPITAPVVEEDEDSEEPSTDDEEYDADRGFVVDQGGNDEEDDDSDRSSFRTRGGFSSEDEEDEIVHQQPAPVAEMNQLSLESSSGWRDSTHKDGQFDVSAADTSISSSNQERSFDASRSNPLPEGFTITGNQSGMTTGMVLAETATISPNTSSVDRDEPCDPYEAINVQRILELTNPHPLRLPEARDLSTFNADKLAGLQKTAKKRGNAGRKSYDKTGVIEESWPLELDGETFSVCGKLGEGAFGAVFRVATLPDSDNVDYDPLEDEKTIAVKVERPANLWEYHILNQLHARLPPRISSSVIQAQRLYAYRDESFLFLDLCDQGTLLDAVNKAADAGIAPSAGGVAGIEEIVAMFFIVELLRVLEGFHNAKIVHGDLKIDNCLIRLDSTPGGARSWLAAYDRTGGGGWESKGLKVIDFGRSIDLNAYPEGQKFTASFDADQYDCLEMREGRSWTYEPDYFGVASIAFNTLFGRYIETQSVTRDDGSSKQAINQTFRRYHQVELWGRLFDLLLNPHSVHADGSLPITNELASLRSDMEDWLTKNSEKGKSLKGFLRKMEAHSMAR